MTPKPSDAEVIELLIAEVRSCEKLLDDLRYRLSLHRDLDKLSLLGAVDYLIRRSKVLAAVETHKKLPPEIEKLLGRGD